jgi:hypothetical protein
MKTPSVPKLANFVAPRFRKIPQNADIVVSGEKILNSFALNFLSHWLFFLSFVPSLLSVPYLKFHFYYLNLHIFLLELFIWLTFEEKDRNSLVNFYPLIMLNTTPLTFSKKFFKVLSEKTKQGQRHD